MSDHHSDNESLSSNTTIENDLIPFEQVLKNLRSAANDAIDTNDYLSYSTLLDVYLSEPAKYSYDERELLLGELLDILKESDDLVYEIGWDIPSVIIDYIDSDFQFQDILRKGPGVYKTLKIFELLAQKGNPKELFLKACELLNTVSIHNITSTDDYFVREKFLDLKLHCLIELVNSNFTKIETLYPSRFLSMFTSALLNFINNNFRNFESHNLEFLIKRLYSFSRNYKPLPLPESADVKEIETVKKDEEYLQRKLLVSFISNAIYLCGNNWSPNESVLLLSKISNKELLHVQDLTPFERFYELCLSYDIDFNDLVTSFVVSTNELCHKFKFDANSKDDDQETILQIFEIVLKDFQDTFLGSITDSKEIKINELGLLIIYNHHLQASYPKLGTPQLSLKDSILVTIRLIVPMLIEPSYNNKSLHDLVVSLSWISLQSSLDSKKPVGIQLELSSIPKSLLKVYFTCLIYILSKSSNSPGNYYERFRFVVLTLLTKLLTLSPEQTCYEFIRDSITECPYHSIKASLVGVLKELLTKDKPEESGNSVDDSTKSSGTSAGSTADELTKGLDSLNLNKPALPSRDIEKSTKFMSLTTERFQGIISMIKITHSKCFIEVEDIDSDTEVEDSDIYYKLNPYHLAPLSALLNLLVVLKKNEIFINAKSDVEDLIKPLKVTLNNFKAQYKGSENECNMADMLLLTLDRV